MVFHTIDTQKRTVLVFDDAPDVAIQLFAIDKWQCFSTILCAEDNMIKNLTKTAHRLLRPGGATRMRGGVSPGYVGGYRHCVPSGRFVFQFSPLGNLLLVLRSCRYCSGIALLPGCHAPGPGIHTSAEGLVFGSRARICAIIFLM